MVWYCQAYAGNQRYDPVLLAVAVIIATILFFIILKTREAVNLKD